ncbi:ACT domain-containing protein ACR3 [Arabidopsis thaliana]|jgi:UTP:GlnB (protein PII) uridylyltransferase|uniref:ACT domain-containing protein ACR3 n=4 Tax=Arabidopsis TaxID=3701 RepID=ACR3_ARATH|nr:ACT domain repeat 3 [Arabidopsis thaliana]NP_001117608.1 ACT domain repeat 3 [Arabidopsis thaliana]NP_565146.1 ACT domain repeat 3 [Arabidopsis thaliana]NP_849896.1 ACT domain repeat 3 [Arabidopsis thaliana]NP_849897.1 ACT domain repeat 3 [Arabidopsis thaliana]O49285.1 RecName: Full=ACT domain-containing protein ACR3; AltName: Full=Protein ACT DOMAIN REPEATS 3 [Arabidopsis thaliana]KAG7651978.1 ACT domain [Arabidopsis thaliana x Arabidopsis arenosa]KAG7659843.1 ACT domain [Arabidopsis sue|eukprot:NP_001031289.1 ACT domain repeat 3 [Arabidopsis thaliana]
MAKVYWPYFDPEYENLSSRINPPSVSIDNTSCKECTLVKVDSMNKPGILLEVVQVLTDLDLTITKAYISSDGGWFMDVFHVTDQQGNKVTDSKTIDYIEKVLGPKGHASASQNTWPGKRVGVHSLGDHTSIEIIARDRPGLLSEVSAVLADLNINVVAAEAWTHNRRIACVLYVNDNATSRAVDDPERLSSMEEQLNNVLRGCEEQDEKFARTSLSIGSTHVDRRLHQMFFADRDYEAVTKLDDSASCGFEPKITVEHCEEKGYSVINVSCEDRPKLMFDIVCTLTDMQYIVFHATISSSGSHASQEYFIRHKDGCTLDTEGEKERVVKCLEAAIHRRVSEGWSLELCAKDRVGLLSEVTRILREHGLSVSRAGVTTVGEQAVNVFYVKDASGNPVDVKTIEALRGEIGHSMMIDFKNKVPSRKWKEEGQAGTGGGWAKTSFFFGNLLEKLLP